MRLRRVALTASRAASAQAEAPSYIEGVGDLEAAQLGDHRLELEDPLERALRALRLVRRVRSQELAAVLEVVDERGPAVVVHAAAEETRAPGRGAVPAADALNSFDELSFGEAGIDLELALEPNGRWDRLEECVQRIHANRSEHLLTVFVGVLDVGHGMVSVFST